MNRRTTALAAILLLSACEKPAQTSNQANEAAPVSPAPSAPAAPTPANQASPAPAPAPPAPGTPGGLPDDKSPLEEPKGAIDPKSAEAAGQVVQHYGALIEQKRFGEAERLWGDAATAKQTTAELKRYSEAHLQVGKPYNMEGAAGSSYITVPVVLYGTLDGKSAHRSGDAILRRVNDVPGSTAAQRRWHFERIDWKNGA
jgi:hypothetical protein